MAMDRNGNRVLEGTRVAGVVGAHFVEGVAIEVVQNGCWLDTVTVYVEKEDKYLYCDAEDMEVRPQEGFYLEVVNG